ncbi:hypothetical protein PVAP13_7KG409900 [Panicum virgatum]|uniref:Uncharacterized protein n=1 Tax=Panicum virgatum TaxID=38727 RepID=A0A8T0QPT9_PANVG|nr:hypothetical protein PVAP13_7KG409900 [Panicum virgatum]
MRRHLLRERLGDAVIWVVDQLAALAPVTGARMEAEGEKKNGSCG